MQISCLKYHCLWSCVHSVFAVAIVYLKTGRRVWKSGEDEFAQVCKLEREREIYGEGATMRSSNHQWLSISSLSPLIRMWSCSLNDDLLQLLLRGPHACSGDVSIDESLAFWMSLYLSTQLSFLFLRRILSLTLFLILILILILHVPVVALFSTACSYDCAVIVVVLVSCASFVSPSSPS